MDDNAVRTDLPQRRRQVGQGAIHPSPPSVVVAADREPGLDDPPRPGISVPLDDGSKRDGALGGQPFAVQPCEQLMGKLGLIESIGDRQKRRQQIRDTDSEQADQPSRICPRSLEILSTGQSGIELGDRGGQICLGAGDEVSLLRPEHDRRPAIPPVNGVAVVAHVARTRTRTASTAPSA